MLMPAISILYQNARKLFGEKTLGLRSAARWFDMADPNTRAVYVLALVKIRPSSSRGHTARIGAACDYVRNVLKAARTSWEKSCGCSQAAK